jgi:hypothetical protein
MGNACYVRARSTPYIAPDDGWDLVGAFLALPPSFVVEAGLPRPPCPPAQDSEGWDSKTAGP